MDSLFYKWSKNGNKMIVNSDFKEFNKQTNYISYGNIIANTMYSNYIRPWDETINPIGQRVEKGRLFNYDLQYFHISSELREFIKSLNKKVVLYEIFIYRYGKKDIIGWLIEDIEFNIIYDRIRKTQGDYDKRYSALNTVKNIIMEKRNK